MYYTRPERNNEVLNLLTKPLATDSLRGFAFAFIPLKGGSIIERLSFEVIFRPRF